MFNELHVHLFSAHVITSFGETKVENYQGTEAEIAERKKKTRKTNKGDRDVKMCKNALNIT